MTISVTDVTGYHMSTERTFIGSGIASVELKVNRGTFNQIDLNGNYYNIKSSLTHESMHWSDPNLPSSGNTSSYEDERIAIKAQFDAGGWRNASPEY